MTVIGINKKRPELKFALMEMGFRPFFLGALAYSIISMAFWIFVYRTDLGMPLSFMNSMNWHAHEMIYGYSMAVIAGFLLTAVTNWTGIQTVQNLPLSLMFGSWVTARAVLLAGDTYITFAAAFDLIFILFLLFAIIKPVVAAKSYQQIGIISKLALFLVGNALFYWGAIFQSYSLIQSGLYLGFYLVISLILTIGSRVMPMFIKNGVMYEVEINVHSWLNQGSLIFTLVLLLNELIFQNQLLGISSCLLLFAVNMMRISKWYTPGIWSNKLLYSLYLGFVFIALGILCLGLHYLMGFSKYLAIHIMAVGGIGLVTLSMMARVIQGHTGRILKNVPRSIGIAFVVMIVCTIFRVLLPVVSPNNFATLILVAQLLWIASGIIFLKVFGRILFVSRVDGQPG